jgi:hypothetical protein
MFSKIIKNIKGSDGKSKDEKLIEKISKMDLTEMRTYINGKLNEYGVSEFGLCEIMKKLTVPNEKTSALYLKDDDQDSKKKKVFDLVVLILSSKVISVNVVERVQGFLDTYEEIIKKYDKENKQIYQKKIKESVSLALDKISFKTDLSSKMRTLK